MFKSASRLSGILLALILACGGGGSGGGSGSSGTSSPSTFTQINFQSISPSQDHPGLYVLTYAPSSLGPDSDPTIQYMPEFSWPGHSWTMDTGIGFGPIYPTDSTLYLQVGDGAFNPPEGITVSVRIIAIANGVKLSNITSQVLPQVILPAPPVVGASWDSYHDWVVADCFNKSKLATAFEFEASVLDGNGSPTTWTPLETAEERPNPAGTPDIVSAHYLPMENVPVAFRVRVHTTTLASIWTTITRLSSGDLLKAGYAAPIDLSATSDSNGIHLSWTNRSNQGLNIELRRTFGRVLNPNDISGIQGSILTILPPGTTSYIDHPEAPGDYTYSIELTDGTQTVFGSAAQVTTFDGLATVYHAPIFGVGAHGIPEPNGNWLWAQNTVVEFDGSGNYLDTGLGQYNWINPGPLYDAGGYPHLFAFGPNTPFPVTHAWKDASGWHHESPGNGAFTVAVQDPNGGYWLCGMPDPVTMSTIATVQLLHGSTGTWTSSSVSSPLGNIINYPISNFDACGGPDGTLYFIYTAYKSGIGSKQYLLIRLPDGTVNEYQIPDLMEPSIPYDSARVVGMVADTSNQLHLFRSLSSNYHQIFHSGDFSPPETLPQPTFAWTPLSSGGGRPVISQSGTRLAWIESSSPQGLWMMDSVGWHYYTIPTVEFYGFAGDKFWYTSPVSDSLWSVGGIQLFKEP